MSAIESILSPEFHLVITDTETTGIHALRNRIIEIAALRVKRGEPRKMFSHLIDPGLSIPHRITRITGITSAMVFEQPMSEEIMPLFRDFLGDAIFVAHNIRFDLSFINAEFQRIGLEEMDNSGLCTLRLARRLLPGLRSKSLGNLAKFFRIPPDGRHRASRDVEITTEVLERLSRIAIDDHGVTAIEELIEMQARTYAKVNPFSRHVVAIKRDILPELPDAPGVYFMKDGRDKVLYVGKAKNLSQRVSSYFSAIEAHPPRIRQLIARVRNVTWSTTETELHALIDESRDIKVLDPPLNRAQKKYIPRPYLALSILEDFPRLRVQVIVRDDGSEYFGPLRSRSQARTIVEIVERYFIIRNCSATEFAGGRRCVRADIGRCGAPCDGSQSSPNYFKVIDRVRSFLTGEVEEVIGQIEADMTNSSQKHAFEEAAQLRDWIQLLDDRLVKTGSVASPVLGPDHVHFLRGLDSGAGSLVMVSRGKIVMIKAIWNVQKVAGHICSALLQDAGSKMVMDQIQTDARRILDHWLYINRSSIESVERREDEPESSFAARAQDVFSTITVETVLGDDPLDEKLDSFTTV